MWPLSDSEYQARQERSRRVTVRPRDPEASRREKIEAIRQTGLLARHEGPRPGETVEEWLQVKKEAANSVLRRLHLDIHIRG